MASVITKDWIRNQVVPMPLASPNTAPTSAHAGTISHGLQPRCTSSMAAVIEPTPSSEPTERSMPPVRITSVTPTARMPREENAVIALSRLVWFQKIWPLVIKPTRITSTRPT